MSVFWSVVRLKLVNSWKTCATLKPLENKPNDTFCYSLKLLVQTYGSKG